jgi:hypothetical protein
MHGCLGGSILELLVLRSAPNFFPFPSLRSFRVSPRGSHLAPTCSASLGLAPTWLRHAPPRSARLPLVPPRSARLAIFWTHSARFPLFSRSPRSARHPLILLRSAPKVKSQKVPSQMRRPQLPTRQMSCLVIIYYLLFIYLFINYYYYLLFFIYYLLL